MYKLVIVEDERDVRRRIISLLEKAGKNFELVAEYENGIDAYDGILGDNPDLIITDIRIPYINGIEMVKKVREVLPLVKVGIITGYNEFDYAKEAANLGVLGFISKPVTLEDISALLQKAQAALDSEYVTATNLSQLETFYENSLPIIRENDLYRLSGMSQVSPAFEDKLKYNDIDLQYRFFAMCVFDFDKALEGGPERYDLAFSSVRKVVSEEFKDVCNIEMFNRYENLCIILKTDEELPISALEKVLECVILRVSRYSDMPLSVGISNLYGNDKNFAKMMKEARRALEYRGVMGGHKVFFFGNAKPISAAKLVVDDNTLKELGYLVRFQSAEECVAAMHDVKQQLAAADAQNSYFFVLTGMLNVLIKACDDLEGLYVRYGGQDSLYRRLFEIKTTDEMDAYFEELIYTIRELNDEVIVDNVERNLQKVVAYMGAHFCDPDISFETMAGEVNFSVSYISALLKRKLNTSFVKRLTGLRMEKAKELLSNPSLKIIDVAEQLGYNDSYYFSHCFKKYTGVSPKEFRNSNE
jgi:two-component system response regulator YesN